MDPKQLALAHFEKAILGVAAVWLLITGVGFLGDPGGKIDPQALEGDIADIKNYMSTVQVEKAKAPDWQSTLSAQLSPRDVISASEFPEWVMHRRPQIIYRLKDAGPTHAPVHRAPVDVQLDTSERGKVIVAWQQSVQNEYVLINEYEIERKNGEEGEWESVGTVPGMESRYEDSTIKSRAAYWYRVISHAEIDRDNPVVRHENMSLPEKEGKQISDEAGPAETARDVYVLPITVTQVTDEILIKNPDAIESAYLKVWKWDNDEGKWMGQAFTVKVGEKIGAKKKRRGKVLDYETGAELVDVEVRKRKHKLGHEESVQFIKVKWPDGSEEEANDKDKPDDLKDSR